MSSTFKLKEARLCYEVLNLAFLIHRLTQAVLTCDSLSARTQLKLRPSPHPASRRNNGANYQTRSVAHRSGQSDRLVTASPLAMSPAAPRPPNVRWLS